MKRASSLVLALALALGLALSACAPTSAQPSVTPSPTPTASDTPTKAPGGDTVGFTDSSGRVVELPASIERVAPSGPLAQMVLFALAPEKFVCLASEWSPETEQFIDTAYYNLPAIGQLYGSSAGELNLESLAAADPQIIIDIGEPKKSVVEDMDAITEQTGIPAVHIDAYTATMGDAYRALGKLLGLEERAETLAAYCDEIYANTQTLMEKVGDKKVSALYLLGDKGLNVIAQSSYHAEILDLMTENAAVVDEPSSKGSGNEVDMEQILLWDPEVMIFAPGSVYSSVKDDPAWSELSAIQSGRYYQVPFGPYNWMGYPPSVNRYLGMLWLGTLLYPEQADYDLYEEVARYYKLFYHADLTHAQYEVLTQDSIRE